MNNSTPALVNVITTGTFGLVHSLGFIVADTATSNITDISEIETIMDVVVKYLGFTRLKDYVNAFAIKSLKNSTWGEFYTKDSTHKEKYKNNIKFVCSESIWLPAYKCNDWNKKRSVEEMMCCIAEASQHLDSNSFMLPVLMKDVINIFGSEFIKKENLWFCEDWSEK